MNINFILSETTASATSAALRDIVGKAENNLLSNFIVLVPEPKSIAIERELLDLSKVNAFSNIFIYSFVRLLSRIGKIDEQNLISKQSCVMLLRKIIIDNFENLGCYKKTARSVGFAEKIYETIEQLKSSGLNCDDVKEIAELSSGALKSKMQDISILFEEYQNVLSGGLLDDCDRLKKLSEFAKTSEFVKDAEIFVVGFDNVTADMIGVLKEFAKCAKSITFSCCYFNENRKDKYIQNNELYHKFASIAESLNYPYVPKFVKANYHGDFWNMQNYLFSTEKKQTQSDGSVEIFALENKENEFNFLANTILKEVQNGKRFNEIAVVDGEFENDLNDLCKTFDDYEIPYFVTNSYDISNHFFVKFIKTFFEVFASNFSVDKVLKLLSNPIINVQNFEDFENYVKEFGINYSAFFEEATSKQIDNDEKREKINEIIKFLKELKTNFADKILKCKTVSDYIYVAQNLFQFFDVESKLQQIKLFEKENNLLVEAEITDVIFEKVHKINDNIKRFLGKNSVDILQFLQIYMSGFAEDNVNLVPLSVDAVLIQKNIDGLYKIKDLFVAGAIDGAIPVKMQDTGILLDSEIESSATAIGKSIEPTIKQINKRENYAIFEMMLVPAEKLFVSYSLHSHGASCKRTSVVDRICNLFQIEEKKYFENSKYLTKKSSENLFAKQMGLYFNGEIQNVSELNDDYNKLKNVLSKPFKDYIDCISFGEKEFVISNAKEIYFVGNKTSVSQLEKYFACPYNFFASYGLRLKENKDASLSSMDIGTIVHKFAELFTKNIADFLGLNETEFDKKTLEILNISLEELNINLKKNVAVLKFISDELIRLAKYLFLEQEKSSFKNDAKLNEFEFKGANSVKLKINENTIISIEGKIDRIDKFGDYIRIIDYKTGETDNSLGAVFYGKKIQLVSYLSASDKIAGKKVAGLFYFPIHSDFVKIEQKMKNNYKMQGFLLDDINVSKYMDCDLNIDNPESNFVPMKIKNNKEVRETGELILSGNLNSYLSAKDFKNIKAYTEKLCTLASAEILSGYIEPSPIAKMTERESNECNYCKLAGFCGKEHSRFEFGRRCDMNVKAEVFNEETNCHGN